MTFSSGCQFDWSCAPGQAPGDQAKAKLIQGWGEALTSEWVYGSHESTAPSIPEVVSKGHEEEILRWVLIRGGSVGVGIYLTGRET